MDFVALKGKSSKIPTKSGEIRTIRHIKNYLKFFIIDVIICGTLERSVDFFLKENLYAYI